MIKTRLFTLLCALAAVPLAAATETLKADAAVFSSPDPQSAVLARLKAGAKVTPAEGEAPAGWRRVEIGGPFEAFARNRDINKALEVREGASIHSAPREDAPVLTMSVAGDKTEVTGLARGGQWCKVKVVKNLTGFIAVGETANLPPPATDTVTFAVPAPPPSGGSTAGRPAPAPGNSADLPRNFEGRLVAAARAIINPNPPYDYQLVDSNGRRFAYVDMKAVRLNDRIENFVDRTVTVTGTLRNTVDGKDLVVAAESLRLK